MSAKEGSKQVDTRQTHITLGRSLPRNNAILL